MDPVGFLPVDVGDLLWVDAVQQSDLLGQVQQRQLLQVERLVDCRGRRRRDAIRSQVLVILLP